MWCEKDHRLVRVEVNLNEASEGGVTCGAQEILINDWCTGSNHHGGGGMAFLDNGDMVMAVGDMSKVCKVCMLAQESIYSVKNSGDVIGFVMTSFCPSHILLYRRR